MIAVDPAVGLILQGSLSLLFAQAASHKLRDFAYFRSALAGYAVLPARWVGPCAVGVIALESAVAAGVWLPGLGALAGIVAAGLLVLYAAAMLINLARGRRDIDCGCGGAAEARPLSGALVVRNGVLAVGAAMTALPTAARALNWLDAVTIMGGVATLLFLYAAADTLLANAPRLGSLRISLPRMGDG